MLRAGLPRFVRLRGDDCFFLPAIGAVHALLEGRVVAPDEGALAFAAVCPGAGGALAG